MREKVSDEMVRRKAGQSNYRPGYGPFGEIFPDTLKARLSRLLEALGSSEQSVKGASKGPGPR